MVAATVSISRFRSATEGSFPSAASATRPAAMAARAALRDSKAPDRQSTRSRTTWSERHAIEHATSISADATRVHDRGVWPDCTSYTSLCKSG
eukprot:7377262-Prymnesium_polylepis.1